MMKSLISLFDEVKTTYFLRWDPVGEWKVRRKIRLSEGYNTNARCNHKTKTIEINRSFITHDDDELRWLLAHEMCHAVEKGNHGKKWQKRFLKVANKAELLGKQPLAKRIHEDVTRVQNARKPTLGSIPHSIEDAVMDQPDASYEEVIEWVASNWGYTSYGLSKKYRSLEVFFNKAKKNALIDRELREKYQIDSLG